MIVAALRIKNEQRWLASVLSSLLPLCEQIHVFDDHSTDETPYIAKSFPEVRYYASPFSDFNETRDKNHLLEKIEAIRRAGDHVVMIDGDEVLESGGQDKISKLAKDGHHDAYRFQVLYLWNNDKQIRTDGIYGRFFRASMFRLQPGLRFKSHVAGGFHCGNVPGPPEKVGECNVKLLHYGYMHKADRIRKWEFYSGIDPKNVAEGYDPTHPERRSYPWVVQGDVPEVPANVKLRHAGPLELRAL